MLFTCMPSLWQNLTFPELSESKHVTGFSLLYCDVQSIMSLPTISYVDDILARSWIHPGRGHPYVHASARVHDISLAIAW